MVFPGCASVVMIGKRADTAQAPLIQILAFIIFMKSNRGEVTYALQIGRRLIPPAQGVNFKSRANCAENLLPTIQWLKRVRYKADRTPPCRGRDKLGSPLLDVFTGMPD
ncbi:hypothetical protein PY650_25255 [Rhizobium calliandrae]|uniref:Uncharacterized protein n=1 Tax=Rhizobium calliandrae TaxID=1312182 RepID=A0ABT7KJU2_9HYPH|nr:hypothetical protein [Rhizobium calliandrae]MDL2408886.1 hypothetical protein [Rhizobium calliandrae]